MLKVTNEKVLRPQMLLSLPNTGSDWFAETIRDNNDNLKYFREYFNPFCNEGQDSKLRKVFGCELISCYKKIACECDLRTYNSLLDETWWKHEYNFTKENYSAFQVKNHQTAFNCFVLYRCLEQTLPPNKNKVNDWYEAMYCSLVVNKDNLEEEIKSLVEFCITTATTTEETHAAAHTIYYHKLLVEAAKFDLPVIEYSVITESSAEEVRDHLSPLAVLGNMDSLTDAIIKTRKRRKTKNPYQKFMTTLYESLPSDSPLRRYVRL